MNLALNLKQKLVESGKTIAVAESLTGGHLQATITSVSGASDYFLGGVTAYNIDQKVKLLGVDRQHAAEVNCVSQQVAIQMAAGVRNLFGSDIGLATTGYAEPWPEGGVKTPFAFIAIDLAGTVESVKIENSIDGRVEVQRSTVESTLQKLLDLL